MTTIAKKKRTFPVGLSILGALALLGLVVAILRYVRGLGATTALSDAYPWGLWIGFDLLCGVALAAGAFTVAAGAHIFNLKKYHAVLRPAIFTGFLGYLLVIMALLVDLGHPYRIWHLMIFWNLHSPLFEVGWCVMLYTTVLALEFSPLVFERFNLEIPLRLIKGVTIPLVIAGIVLSTMHQSSLGSLFLIMPDRLHALWYTPLLPVFFFISAVAAGLAMVIFESSISSIAFQRGLEIDVLSGLAKAIPFILGLYLVLKMGDLVASGDFGRVFEGSLLSNLFLVEMVVGVLLPIVLFSFPRVRRSGSGLFWGALLVIGGLILNRLNVGLIGLKSPAGASYFPHWMEFSITIALISFALIAYTLAARFLPLFPERPAETS